MQEKVVSRNSLPFSPLSLDLLESGWLEERMRGDKGYFRRITIPRDEARDLKVLQTLENVDCGYLKFRTITQDEATNGMFDVPDDCINLANISFENMDLDQEKGETMIPAINACLEKLKITDVDTNQIIFSPSEKIVILLPHKAKPNS